MAKHPVLEIGIVPFPGAQLAAIYGLIDLFKIADTYAARHFGDDKVFLRITQRLPPALAPIANESLGIELKIDKTPTVLILPPKLGTPLTAEEATPYADWLIASYKRGTVLASACGGAFMLAEAGLLDGRSVTTHWDHADVFGRRFPEARLDVDKLIIDDGDIISAGGLMAWVDMGLKLVDRFLGPVVMVETARYMLVDPPGREQRYYSAFSPNLKHGDASILKVQHRLQAEGAKDVTLSALASVAGLEERTFLRRFRKATGLTAGDYCQRLRVGKACELLQFSAAPVETIAWQVGYGDPSAFRKVFLKITGLTPGDYRRRFNVNPPQGH
jgi:transcriptional regulator GlxA family with amidase domain